MQITIRSPSNVITFITFEKLEGMFTSKKLT